MTRVLAPGLGSWKNGVVWLDDRDMGVDPLYMWERVGMQGFSDDLQEEVSISGWLLAYILDAIILEVSVAVQLLWNMI